MSKYKAKKATRTLGKNHYVFDSRAEAAYFDVLVSKLEANEIRDFSVQPKFKLTLGYKVYTDKTKSGISKVGGLTYTPDFRVHGLNGEHVIVEVKGKITTDYAMRKKLFIAIAHDKYKVDTFIEVIKSEETWYDCRSVEVVV